MTRMDLSGPGRRWGAPPAPAPARTAEGTPTRGDDARLQRLPVLMYHGVHASPGGPGLYNSRYSVTPDRFAEQLDWLQANDFATCLLGGPSPSGRSIVLTFDDGDASAVDVALPMLLERGMVGEFCIPSARVGTPGSVTAEGVRQLAEAGMGIQSHGRTHRQLSTLPPADLTTELVASKRELEDWSGRPVDGLSAPGGRAGARELRAAHEAGYRWVLNSVPGPNRHHRPGTYLHRTVVTSATTLEAFAGLVLWRGTAPARLVLRTAGLEVSKRLLGGHYTRARKLLSR